MTTIRPNAFPQVQPRPQPPESPKMEAQRAFFAALAGTSQAASSQAPAGTAPIGTEAAARPAATGAEPPQKILRPGSIIDIRV